MTSSQPQLRSMPLREFCRITNVLNADTNKEAAIKFVLEGRFCEDDVPCQAIIDTSANLVPDNFKLTTSRDYDSLIGIVKTLPMTAPLMVYPVPNPKDTLKANNHLTYPISTGEVTASVSLAKIPNIALGMWNVRHSVHVFFPRLYSKGRSSQLKAAEKETFYASGLRPAIENILPLDISDWPPSYDAEMFRARTARGGYSYASKNIPSWFVSGFAQEIEDELAKNHVDWAEDMFFLLTVRGTKAITRHHVDAESAKIQLDNFLISCSLGQEVLTTGTWYIDVGVEISAPSYCLQWKTEGHSLIVEHALEISQSNADRITSIGSSKYSRDLSSNLTGVSGCRIEPGARAEGPYEAAYLQLYSTDKSVTYHPEGLHHAKAMTMAEALGPKHPAPFVKNLFNTYNDALRTVSSSARIEIRVPIKHALKPLISLIPDVLRDSLLAFTRPTWWAWRLWRVIAIGKVLQAQARGKAKFRTRPDALLLTAACLWLLNSLHARPEDGPAARRLMDAVLPLKEKDEGDLDSFAYRIRRPRVSNDDDEDWMVDEEEEEEEAAEGEGEGEGDEEDVDGLQEEEEEEEGEPQQPRRRRQGEDILIDSSLAPYCPYGAIFLRSTKINVEVPRMRAGGPFLPAKAFYFIYKRTHEGLIDSLNPEGLISRADLPNSGITRNRTRHTTEVPPPSITSQVWFDIQGFTLAPPATDNGSDIEDSPVGEDGRSNDINVVATTLYRQFLSDLLSKAPNIGGRSRRSYLKLTEVQRSTNGSNGDPEIFQTSQLPKLWRACQYQAQSKTKWRQAFNHCFPAKRDLIPRDKQNYPQCRYFKRWLRLGRANDTDTMEAIRDALFTRIYDTFTWFPHAGSDRMWVTSKLVKPWPRYSRNVNGTAAPRLLLKKDVTYEWDMDVDTDTDTD